MNLVLLAFVAHILSFGGYGSTEGVVVRGRVERGKPLVEQPGRRRLAKVVSTARAFVARDVEGARLRVRDLAGTAVAELRADDEGFFEARLPGPFPAGPRVFEVTVVEPRVQAPPLAVRLDIVEAASGLVAITDIDDTLIATGVTGSKAKLIARIAVSGAVDIVPFTGAAEAMRAFAGAGVPIVYLSASPIELATRLNAFLELRGFPPGALFLRHYEDEGFGNPTLFKRKRIELVLADFPGRKLVLFGDNGEKDRQIFAALARETGRVAFAYIRRTLPDDQVIDGQLVFAQWAEVTAHACALMKICPSR